MKILWMTWKDRSHPRSGGAEIVNEEIARRLARDGHEVIFLVAGFSSANSEETRDGYRIIRLGSHFSVYWKAYRYYKQHLQGWADVVIDELNTMPFFCRFYVKEKVIFFPHQLCREIWFYQMSFPLNVLGYLLEPVYLWLLRGYDVVTISESTKRDLLRYGFRDSKIAIISEGIEIEPVAELSLVEKYSVPTLLSLGSIREMKRTAHQVQAFELAKKDIPMLQMKIAGDASSVYGKEVLDMIVRSPYAHDIEYLGKVSKEGKKALMQKSHVIGVTSVKEGWGLIVTEANSQGTPAVAYNVDGLRDSIRSGETGIITSKNSPEGLSEAIVALLKSPEEYDKMRTNAWQWSQRFSFDHSYGEFLEALKK